MSGLRARLVERIAAGGPLTFAAYMEAALFDPADGFYTGGPGIGQGGHFATAAMAHPAFADAMVKEAAATWEALGRPKAFRVTEAGPGTGGLARRVSEGLDALGIRHELALIERSTGLAARQRETLDGIPATWVEHPAELKPTSGFLYANELVDALPVRLLQWPDEVLVGADGDRLVEVLRPADAAVTRLLPAGFEPRVGGRYAVRPGMIPLLASLAGSLRRGRIALIDYGGVGTEVHDGRRPPVRTYIGGQPGGDPLQAPGTQDLTADVDFGALSDAAGPCGLEVEALLTQPAWLRGHGWEAPPAETRTEEDWALAGLLDERLPFMVWLARR